MLTNRVQLNIECLYANMELKNFQDNWSELPSIKELKLEVKRNWENHFYPFLTRGYATENLRI